MPNLSVLDTSPAQAKADALVLFTRPGAQGPTMVGDPDLPKVAAARIRDGLAACRAQGSADEVVRLPGVEKVTASLVVLAGVGGQQDVEPSEDACRRAAGAAVRALAGRATVAVVPPRLDVPAVVAVAEGAELGAYGFTHHLSVKGRKEAQDKRAPVREVVLLAPKSKELREGVERAAVVAAAQAWARDLVNRSPNDLYPGAFAEEVAAKAPKNVAVEVLDEAALAKGGFGGILGVGQGSARPPRIVTMRYAPRRAAASLAYVGKGITFDSGGLCIKPANSMITMKCDMAGAAAVAAAVVAVARLGLPVAVTGYLCLAENMPGANAQRPGDVVTMRDGQTVEVINTDAEGRMVLGDGIALAAESHPDAIVDVATLTGAAIVALGNRTAAVMANDEQLQADLTTAATRAGESVWPMPIAEETRAGMDSLVADFKHTGENAGGAMVAAAFLREFVGTTTQGRPTPWGHLDIAGPAYNEKSAHGYTPKGGTGFAVRTLIAHAQSRA